MKTKSKIIPDPSDVTVSLVVKESPPPSPVMSVTPHRRTGKIARLPAKLREKVNLMLNNGATYAAILKFLASKGHDDIEIDSVYNWHKGGFQDWLRAEERSFVIRDLRNWARRLAADDNPMALPDAMINFTCAQLQQVLDCLDVALLREMLVKKPEKYPLLANTLARMTENAIYLEKLRQYIRIEREKRNPPPPRKADDVQPQTITKLEDALHLFSS